MQDSYANDLVTIEVAIGSSGMMSSSLSETLAGRQAQRGTQHMTANYRTWSEASDVNFFV